MKTTFVSDCVLDNIDDVKLAALYFDEIEIIRRFHVEDIKLIKDDEGARLELKTYSLASQDFLDHLAMLEKEEVVSFVTSSGGRSYAQGRSKTDWDLEAKRIISENAGVIFPGAEIKERSDSSFSIRVTDDLTANAEAEAVYRNHLKQVNKLKDFDSEVANKIYYLVHYYTFLFEELIRALGRGEPCVTASVTLNRLLASYAESETFQLKSQELVQSGQLKPILAFECLRMAVPDVSPFSLEDILEFRRQANDELQQFRQYMDQIHFELEDRGVDALLRARHVVDAKIMPALNDLAAKVGGLKLKISRDLLERLRDPKSYTPLLGTLIGEVPSHVAIVASLGLSGLGTALQYLETMREVKKNGVYYLLKARRSFASK